MGEYRIGFRSVWHVLLNTEVGDRQIEMKRSCHGNGRKIRCAVTTGADMKQSGKIRNLFKMCEPSGMHQRHPDAGEYPLRTAGVPAQTIQARDAGISP